MFVSNTQFIGSRIAGMTVVPISVLNVFTLPSTILCTNCEKSIVLNKVSFFNNRHPLTIYGPSNLTIVDCLFDSNDYYQLGRAPSPLILLMVDVFFSGHNTFSNNIGITGGAIYMSQSTLWLDNGTEINFVNNTASNFGGAIYVEEATQTIYAARLDISRALRTHTYFYQLIDNVNPDNQISVHFNNNTARFGGDDIYGASLSIDCIITPDKQTRSYEIQIDIFDFQTPSLSSVSSNPRRVCLCENGVPQCDKIEYIDYRYVSVTSGEKFNISLVLVGRDFGTVTGGVFASVASETVSLGSGQNLQQITSNKDCTTLEYSLNTNHSTTVISLSRDSITDSQQQNLNIPEFDLNSEITNNDYISLDLLYTLVNIYIIVLPCPLGFVLSEDDLTCQCEPFLTNYVHSCRVRNGTGIFYRNGTSWISSTSDSVGINDTVSTILAHLFCPFDYCLSDNIQVDLRLPNEQCAFNHSGILCGGCRPNLSLALGSSQCLPCSNDGHIALFLVFAVAGVALVFFIKIFDLTVAHGTINGLIFYANVIWINQSLFFPSGNEQTNKALVQFLRVINVFIAWINLDFGIETCFLDGLDAYWKTWLQFVFPIYLWILSALIILICRYSTRATKFFGNNAVSVLATLFLLSYVKLLRTIVSVLGFGVIQQYHPEGTKAVWLLDGNVPYLGLRHAFLFIASLLVLFLLWLPFTVIVLFVPLLKKSENVFITRWVNRFKPLFDTYYGPLKDKHHYWIGLTLLVRVILAIVAAAVQAINPTVNVDLVNLASALLCILLAKVYKKSFVFLLELSFLFNLVLISVIYLSTNDIEIRITSSIVSVMVAIVTFLAILVFHCCSILKPFCCKEKEVTVNINDNADLNRPPENDPKSFVTTTTVELRECILES